MSNPYESPKIRNDGNTTVEGWATSPRLFALGMIFMIALNATPLWFTSRAFQTDGTERVGFPFVFFERGGLSYNENWHYEMLAINIGIAFLAAYGIASVLRDGWGAALQKLQTWGLHDIYEEKNTKPRQ